MNQLRRHMTSNCVTMEKCGGCVYVQSSRAISHLLPSRCDKLPLRWQLVELLSPTFGLHCHEGSKATNTMRAGCMESVINIMDKMPVNIHWYRPNSPPLSTYYIINGNAMRFRMYIINPNAWCVQWLSWCQLLSDYRVPRPQIMSITLWLSS